VDKHTRKKVISDMGSMQALHHFLNGLVVVSRELVPLDPVVDGEAARSCEVADDGPASERFDDFSNGCEGWHLKFS
jgi:hypothetical protein